MGRGRPRKNPEKLAQWKPPQGWVRVVTWVSPDDRKALKRAALEEDTSVSELIRQMASTLQCRGGETDSKHINLGVFGMEKIPTIFNRDDHFKVVDTPREGCEWVFQNEGLGTEKLDGTNIRITVRSGIAVHVQKRRNPDKAQKKMGILEPWYVDAQAEDAADQWIFEAVKHTSFEEWPDGEHCCEALGPKIQGNPLGLDHNLCVPFNREAPVYDEVPRGYDALKAFLRDLESQFAPGHMAEGIVFHHPDGRRAKIKRKDFVF